MVTLAALACGGKSVAPPPAPSRGSAPPREPIKPLVTSGVAGEQIAVVPITLVIATDTLTRIAPLGDRVTTLAWADSIIGESFLGRSPEVKWVLPADLRKIARRAPTVSPDPDRMGQALLRAPDLKEVPDPLRGHLRTLVALVGGRLVMVPSALSFVPDSSGLLRAELSLAMADTRTGKILWRTVAWGLGDTPARALTAAMATVLPVGLGLQ
jgi:hypothetical protein